MVSYSRFEHEHIMPNFRYIEKISEDYQVFLNGEEIPVYTCRISKHPFNRVWPGEQRPFTQTEVVSYVNLVSDEPVELTVKINREYKKVFLKPYSKNVALTEQDKTVSFTLTDHGGYVLGANDLHHCLYIFNSKPIQAPKKEDVTHFFGPGVHMPGKIILHSNESVYVDKDALVFGCIYAENAENIHIFGNGIFDDTLEGRLDNGCYEPFTNGNIKFYDCNHIRLEGVGFRNSAIWCVNFFHCTDVVLDNIKVFGQWRYNTDGVDIVNSRDITIRNSFIHSFDDTISIKGIDRYVTTDNEDMLFENCVLWCDWGRVCEIGLETACRRYRNITFRNCDVIRGAHAALDVNCGDVAEISDILFENMRVEFNAFDTPMVFQATDGQEYDAEDQLAVPFLLKVANPRWRSPRLYDLYRIPAEYPPELNLEGIRVAMCHDITFRNITVYYDENLPLKDGKFDLPINIQSYKEGTVFYNLFGENFKVIYKGETYPVEISLDPQ